MPAPASAASTSARPWSNSRLRAVSRSCSSPSRILHPARRRPGIELPGQHGTDAMPVGEREQRLPLLVGLRRRARRNPRRRRAPRRSRPRASRSGHRPTGSRPDDRAPRKARSLAPETLRKSAGPSRAVWTDMKDLGPRGQRVTARARTASRCDSPPRTPTSSAVRPTGRGASSSTTRGAPPEAERPHWRRRRRLGAAAASVRAGTAARR